jgi:hypothetical protein
MRWFEVRGWRLDQDPPIMPSENPPTVGYGSGRYRIRKRYLVFIAFIAYIGSYSALRFFHVIVHFESPQRVGVYNPGPRATAIEVGFFPFVWLESKYWRRLPDVPTAY